MKHKKEINFELRDLLGAGITLAVLGIGLTYAIDVTVDIRDDFTANTAEYNASQDTIDGLAEIPEKIPTLAVIIVAAAILGILVRFLWQRFV